MKMHELFSQIDQSPSNLCYDDTELWANQFDLSALWDWNMSEQLSTHLKGYWVAKWVCTDTWVGLVLWFLDGQPLGTTYKGARKNDYQIEFVSEEAAENLRTLMLHIINTSNKRTVSLIDMNEEVGDYYTVDYGSQLLTIHGTVNGLPATVIKTFDSYNEIDLWRSVVVKTPLGEETVNLADFHIPLPLKRP